MDDSARGNQLRQHVLASTLSNYAGKIIAMGIGFLLTPFILGQLGPVAYGLWMLVGSVVGYGALLDFGIATAIVKYVPEFRARGEIDRARSLVATTLALYSVLGLVPIVLSLVLAPFFPTLFNIPPDQRSLASWLVVLSGFSVGLSIPCSTTSAVLRGLQRFDISNLLSVVGMLLYAAATILVLLLGGGVLGLVAAGLAVLLLIQIPSIWFIQRIEPGLRFGGHEVSRGLARTILSFSFSTFIIDIAGRLQTQTDQIVIGLFMALQAVTPYSLAQKLSEIAPTLTDQFMKVLLPLASELDASRDQKRLRGLYIQGSRLTLAIYLPVGCTLVLLARPLLSVWVGAAYGDYWYLVAILVAAGLVDTMLRPAGALLKGMARHQPLAVMAIGSAIANLVLSVILVTRLGLAGVAIGSLIPTTVEALFFVLPYSWGVIGIRLSVTLREILIPAVLPMIPMVVTLYLLDQIVAPVSWLSLGLVAGASFLVYGIAYLSVGASVVERRAYRTLATSTLRSLQARLRNP